MRIAPQDIVTCVQASLPGADVTLTDLRGDGAHCVLHVRSDLFSDKSRLDQHRMVYKALGTLPESGLPNLSIQTEV